MITNVQDTNSLQQMLVSSLQGAAMNAKFDPRRRSPSQFFNRNSPGFSNRGMNGSRMDRSLLACLYCGKKGHLKAECFKLVEFPDSRGKEGQSKQKMRPNNVVLEDVTDVETPLYLMNGSQNEGGNETLQNMLTAFVQQEVGKAIKNNQNVEKNIGEASHVNLIDFAGF